MMQAVCKVENHPQWAPPSVAPQRRPSQAAQAIVRVENYGAVASAYGDQSAKTMMAAINQRALGFLGSFGTVIGSGLVTTDGEHRLDLVISDTFQFCRQIRIDEQGEAKIAGVLVDVLARDPIDIGGVSVLPVLTVALSADDVMAARNPGASLVSLPDMLRERIAEAAPRTVGVGPDAKTRDRYISDMAVAVRVARAVAKGNLYLAWQPVVGDDEASGTLYHEGLVRFIEADGSIVMPPAIIPSLERLGLTRQLDRQVMLMAIDRLRQNPAILLGCNISAQSAVADGWWAPVFQILRQEPDVAARLIVELTESAAFPSISLAVEFGDRLRSLGCRIAIDDFGVGHAAFSYLAAFKPDIVKVDGLFLRRADGRLDGPEYSGFEHLVGLARSFCSCVIVEGVETARDLNVGQAAGATWFQGFHLGTPHLSLRGKPAIQKQPSNDYFEIDQLMATLETLADTRRAPLNPWSGGLARGVAIASPISALLWFGLWKLFT